MLYCCLNLCKLKERLMIGFVFLLCITKCLNLIGQFLNAATSYFGGLTREKEHRGLQHHQEEIMKGKKVQFLERIIVFSPRLRLIRQVLQ